MTPLLIVIIIIVVAIVGFLIVLYNGLVGKRNRVDEALAQIEVQLKRRHDLIPNLVNAVKGYMDFEQDVSRQHYNASVLYFNTAIQTFPAVLIAGMMGFLKRDFFDAEPEADQVPSVQLR